jgi:divalent metal cation (Fe/Co/Zn/Cd) transporter
LLGRLLGLSRAETFLTVLIGSILGGAVMLAGAEVLGPWLRDVTPAVRYGGIGVIVLILMVLSRRYRRSIAEA